MKNQRIVTRESMYVEEDEELSPLKMSQRLNFGSKNFDSEAEGPNSLEQNWEDKSDFLSHYLNSNPRIVRHVKGGNILQKKKLIDLLRRCVDNKID